MTTGALFCMTMVIDAVPYKNSNLRKNKKYYVVRSSAKLKPYCLSRAYLKKMSLDREIEREELLQKQQSILLFLRVFCLFQQK